MIAFMGFLWRFVRSLWCHMLPKHLCQY